MLLTKSSFERHANKGVGSITSYCADNGQCADTGFQQAIKGSNQRSHIALLGHIIKMELLSSKSRNLPWFLEHCFFMLNNIGQTICQQWCGLLHSKKQHIVLIGYLYTQMAKGVRQLSSTMIRSSLILQYIILMDHHVLCWTLVFNRVLEVHPNGSHNLVLVSMLVTLHLTRDWLL